MPARWSLPARPCRTSTRTRRARWASPRSTSSPRSFRTSPSPRTSRSRSRDAGRGAACAGRRGSRRAAELLARVGAPIDPDRLVESLSMPEQQVVEIAKAIGADARILIMDEPTASLSTREVERLFAVIARLRQHGVGIIYISHRLEEIAAIADRITVLRDGRTIATRATRDVDRAELIRLMVGRELAAVFPKRPVAIGDVALEVRRLTAAAERHPRRVACRSAGERSSGSPGSSARGGPSWPRRCSA